MKVLTGVCLALAASPVLSFSPAALPLRAARAEGQHVAIQMSARTNILGAAVAATVLLGGGVVDVQQAGAVSGGVADFYDVQGQDFTGKDLSKKDFSSANCRGAKFVNANLKGARFFKADMQDADLTGANLSNGSIENAKLAGVILKDAVLKNSYTGVGLELVQDITNTDFTGAILRPDVQKKLCKRADATGTNPKTKADTRESLECP